MVSFGIGDSGVFWDEDGENVGIVALDCCSRKGSEMTRWLVESRGTLSLNMDLKVTEPGFCGSGMT